MKQMLPCKAAAGNARILEIDVPIAQEKLAVFIQESLRFSSTYQIITEADVKIEVSNIFDQVYRLMEQLEVKIKSLKVVVQKIICNFNAR